MSERIEIHISGLTKGAFIIPCNDYGQIEQIKISVPEGKVLDLSEVITKTIEVSEKYGFKKVLLDPWTSNSIIPELIKNGLEVKEVKSLKRETLEKKMTEQTETEQSDNENHITCKNCGYDRCKTKDNYCTHCGITFKY